MRSALDGFGSTIVHVVAAAALASMATLAVMATLDTCAADATEVRP